MFIYSIFCLNVHFFEEFEECVCTAFLLQWCTVLAGNLCIQIVISSIRHMTSYSLEIYYVFHLSFWQTKSSYPSVCDTPIPSVDHGSIENPTSGYLYVGTVLTFVCDDGYVMVGDDEAECLDNGTWTAAPACIRCMISLTLWFMFLYST